MKTTTVTILAALIISGCASVPTDPTALAAYHAEYAQKELQAGQSVRAVKEIMQATDLPTGADRVRAAFAQSPVAKANFSATMDAQIAGISGSNSAKFCRDLVQRIVKSKILSDAESTALASAYAAKVVASNGSGAIPFMIDNDTMGIAELATSDQMRIIFRRTLDAYAVRDYSPRDMSALVAYVQGPATSAADRAEFRQRLPALNVRASELDAVRLVDPAFADRRAKDMTMVAHLEVRNADRLFSDDLAAAISASIRGVTWAPDTSKDSLQIVVERVRNNEKEMPATTRTVTYSFDQVDTFSALLLMPRNASYQFDLKTAGAEIEYGYVVSAWKGGKRLSENVVRGKDGGDYKSCENPRIVNIFGGVTAASFSANDNMRSACNNQTPISLDALRSGVMRKLADQVREVPDIANIHAMN